MLALKFARLNRGLSQTVFGHMAGMRQNDISLIELGRLNPTPAELQRLARALGMLPTDAHLLLTDIPDPLTLSVEPDEMTRPTAATR